MVEAVLGQAFSTIVANPGGFAGPTDAVLYRGSVASGVVPTFTQVGSTSAWTVTFTPLTSGLYTLFVFGGTPVRVNVVTKASVDVLRDLSDEALGSWSWNKQTNVLSLVRQDGTPLATFNMVDNLTTSSRERV